MSKNKTNTSYRELFKTILYALLIAFGIRTFAYEPFSVPSTSMVPTLLVGDYFFVSKYSYGYSKYSFPLVMPLFSGRILNRPPQRGDVAVFKVPTDNKTDYVKRIVGIPGDRVQMIEGKLHINGNSIIREIVKPSELIDLNDAGFIYRETMPNGKSYLIRDLGLSFQDNTKEYLIGPGHYFMMGDNRDNSRDSRMEAGGFGQVPEENLVGRADMIFFSANGNARIWEIWNWPFGVRFDRLGDSLRLDLFNKNEEN